MGAIITGYELWRLHRASKEEMEREHQKRENRMALKDSLAGDLTIRRTHPLTLREKKKVSSVLVRIDRGGWRR